MIEKELRLVSVRWDNIVATGYELTMNAITAGKQGEGRRGRVRNVVDVLRCLEIFETFVRSEAPENRVVVVEFQAQARRRIEENCKKPMSIAPKILESGKCAHRKRGGWARWAPTMTEQMRLDMRAASESTVVRLREYGGKGAGAER